MLYVAYGSNLNVKQMGYRCPGAKIVGTAKIRNYRLLFRRGVLTIEPARGHVVPVAVWDVNGSDLQRLDSYEGYPTLYYKRDFIVKCDDGIKRKVFAYIMHNQFIMESPGTAYMNTCLQGYDDFGFDPNVLYKAAEFSARGGVA